MAKINLAPFISSISGRMGGVVYKNTRFGTALGAYEAPSNPNTAAQRAVRSSFTKATQAWRNLSPSQAGAWNTWAATYNSSNWSGFNWFVSFSSKWYAVNGNHGQAPVNPPAQWFDGDNITVTATASNGRLTWTASGNNASGVTTALIYQRVSGPNTIPDWNNFKTAKYHSFSGGSMSATFNVAPGFYAVGYYFVNTKTGQAVSPVFQAGVIGPVSFSVVTGGQSATKSSPKKRSTKRSTSKKSSSSTKKTAAKKRTTKRTTKPAARTTMATTASTPTLAIAKKSSTKRMTKKSTSNKRTATKPAASSAKSTTSSTPKLTIAKKTNSKRTVRKSTATKAAATMTSNKKASAKTTTSSKPALKSASKQASFKKTTAKSTKSNTTSKPAAKKAVAVTKPTLKVTAPAKASATKRASFKKASFKKTTNKTTKPAAKKTATKKSAKKAA